MAEGASEVQFPASDASQTAPSFADRLAAVAPNQRRAVVIDQIRRDTARVLGLENFELLPNNKPLNELGLDSLMAVELCNCLGNALGRTLPATLLYDYPTVEVLARYLSRSVLGLEEPPAGQEYQRVWPRSRRCPEDRMCWMRSRILMTTKLSDCSKREERERSE